MNAEAFIDTNIFLYALSDREEKQAKAERARQLLLTANWGWSVQVAGEFYHVATSAKRQFRLPHASAMEYVRTWLNFPTASIHPSTVLSALLLSNRFQVSYWMPQSSRQLTSLVVPKSIQKILATRRSTATLR